MSSILFHVLRSSGYEEISHTQDQRNLSKMVGPGAAGKWLSEKALQITVKRREAKSKGEKERYTHLNGEFQRIARRDKKAVQSDQCKERKTIEWERLEISPRKLEIPREHFMLRWTQ